MLVEADPVLRDRQRARLPIESPILVLGPVGPGDDAVGTTATWTTKSREPSPESAR